MERGRLVLNSMVLFGILFEIIIIDVKVVDFGFCKVVKMYVGK
jgi:hypothetical protein